MLVKTRGWIGFSPFLLSSKERGKVGEFPGGGGGHSREVYVELCRLDLQALTLFKTKLAHFTTLFKTGDTTF